jgi:putative peptidoglycan lipid II flippase
LGLGRDVALAALFRAEVTDAFFVAFTIPNALRQLLGEGATSSAVVPVLSGVMVQEGEARARAFVAHLRWAAFWILLAVTLGGMVAAEPLTLLFASGYRDDPPQLARTVQLTRWLFPYIFFMGSAALGMAVLHTHKRFAVAAFAPALLNVALLAAALGLRPWLEARGLDPAYALAAGALVGGALQVVAQWPSLLRLGYPPWMGARGSDPAVAAVARRLVPMTAGIGIYYVDLVFSRRFLSEMGTGAQSHFTWASRVCDLPQGIFALALATAALPTLALYASSGDEDAFAQTFAAGFRLALFVGIPASALLVFVAEPIVALLFQRGQFDSLAARETARALQWQGGAIFAVAAVRQLVPLFHARGDTRTPVVVSALDLGVFLAVAYGATPRFGAVGVSMAVALSSGAQMVLLAAAAARSAGARVFEGVFGSVMRVGVASAVAAAMGARSASAAPATLGGIFGVVAFGVGFLAVAWILRCEELREVAGAFGRRFGRVRASSNMR